ncbi:AMIN-like domain-containing (lipo)protein [Rhodococcus chondri]|uniref:AMIN-like domain-containing protein n=1 Tax=Rhodococcus chondri TaxID=3065941 RepID=A0ABU7JTV1_9NOCA|nr:hypothetical protein [Rhodococcus sp. CC-R104]MEE2033443.1 hypothetical protein [Rhodococcus sp. CC-R104]
MLRTRIAITVTAAGLILAGCSTEGDPTPQAAVAISTPSGDARSDAASATFPTDTADKVSPAGDDAKLTVTEIRTGRHDGFDRVVYELGGTGTPGWRVGYVDNPTQDGSGNPVTVAGGATIQVLIDGSAYPFDSGVEPYDGPDPVLADPGGSVVEVSGSGVFEGVTQSFIGVAEPGTAFSVFSLTGPTRLVVDVAD